MPQDVSTPGSRQSLLTALADRLMSVKRSHPVRAAIDGVDTAGKTVLADELAPVILARGRPIIRASIDGFHRPRAERRRLGPDSPEGYYRDSFDYAALLTSLLLPLGPNGDLRYRRAVFDYRTDSPLDTPIEVAAPDSVLLLDGVFLLRPELVDSWDLSIFVDVKFSTTLDRAMRRDVELFGSVTAVEDRYRRRYIPGQQLYLAEARPREHADIVVANDDPENPTMVPRGAQPG